MTTIADLSHVDLGDPDARSDAGRLNWLRAGVLGANDGIVSVAAIVVGVAGASGSTAAIAAAGTAGLVGGAISMALGEYVSVSGQRDAQRTGLEEATVRATIDAEDESMLASRYEALGVTPAVARAVAGELVRPEARERRAAMAVAAAEDDIVSPWRAAWVSAATFTVGALLPMLAMLLSPVADRVWITVAAVLVALALTGATGAILGGAARTRATVRVVIGGALALAATYAVGMLLTGHAGGI
ncbi:VIT1/CCC1 transporter family protein [Curtobacterium sp. RRHDQ10]|uniref:VIT1/CCC1 transporter family protein n=1 Tax=Curtobacterium phyllosphaerae TaxID=3413379 RepID=UPI003BF3EC07